MTFAFSLRPADRTVQKEPCGAGQAPRRAEAARSAAERQPRAIESDRCSRDSARPSPRNKGRDCPRSFLLTRVGRRTRSTDTGANLESRHRDGLQLSRNREATLGVGSAFPDGDHRTPTSGYGSGLRTKRSTTSGHGPAVRGKAISTPSVGFCFPGSISRRRVSVSASREGYRDTQCRRFPLSRKAITTSTVGFRFPGRGLRRRVSVSSSQEGYRDTGCRPTLLRKAIAALGVALRFPGRRSRPSVPPWASQEGDHNTEYRLPHRREAITTLGVDLRFLAKRSRPAREWISASS